MFDKKCQANNCKNPSSDNIKGMYSRDTPSQDMGWTTVKFCSQECKNRFKKENSGPYLSWGTNW